MTARPLIVADDRSRFTAVSAAWRTWTHDDGSDHETSRRGEVAEQAARALTAPHRPVETRWTHRGGAMWVTAILPAPGVPDWTGRLLSADRATRAPGMGGPHLAAVGPAADVGRLAEVFGAVEGVDESGPAVASVLKSTRLDGIERVQVTGADPGQGVGAAATFVGVCRAFAGVDAVVPAALATSGTGARAQMSRVLVTGRPALRWTVLAPQSVMSTALAVIIDALDGDVIRADEARVDQARDRARADLRRLWRSPHDLATAMAEYAVMGWGGGLVLDPDSALERVTPGLVGQATAALTRPLRDVMGR